MEIPSIPKLYNRSIVTALTSPKIFFGAMLWQGFSYACNCNLDSANFYFITGFGSALGTFLSSVALGLALKGSLDDFLNEFSHGVLYALPVFLGPGTCWQKNVNDSVDWKFTFTGAFFHMFLISTALYFPAVVFLRAINQYFIKPKGIDTGIDTVEERIYFDFLLSLSIAFGDAFFMGTAAAQHFEDNWLAPAFGVYDDTPVFTGMMWAGLSTLCGFLIIQTVQNLVLKDTWLDPKEMSKDESLMSNIYGGDVKNVINDKGSERDDDLEKKNNENNKKVELESFHDTKNNK